ncbi:myo-inositol-1-phosphate synthase, partial [Paraphaeosphaeria sporulosa]
MAPHAEDSVGFANDRSGTAATPAKDLFFVESPNVEYTDETIKSKYTYRTTAVSKSSNGKYVAVPKETLYDFKVDRKIPKLGVMLIGLGGNNGTTVTAGILANSRGLEWETKEGKRGANYYGSVIMGSTTKLGVDIETGADINIPFHDLMPMVHPNDLVIGGWDINGLNLAEAMDRAKVLEPTLKSLLRKEMAQMK